MKSPALPNDTGSMRRRFFAGAAIVIGLAAGVSACAGVDEPLDDEGVAEDADDGEDTGETSEALGGQCAEPNNAGPCAGTALDRAVKCAKAKGATVLSYYRSPKAQECVRRQNRCSNRCTGQAGCVRPTANCTTSGHTRCTAVDLVADGAPLSRAQLRACGLAKTTAPHANHYDLVR